MLHSTPACGDFLRGEGGGCWELWRGDCRGVVFGGALVRGGGEGSGEAQVVDDVG